MFEDLELAEKSRAEGKWSEKRGISIGGSMRLLIRRQIRSETQLSSPSPHLSADRSVQEDAEDAEKKDWLASSGYGRDWLKG